MSRHDDVAAALHDWQTYRSGRGTTADILFSAIEVPPGIPLFEDPPLHDLHRRLLSRVFTLRRMLAVDGLVREFCCRALIRFAIRTGSTSSPIWGDQADAHHRLSAGHPRGGATADP
ncbi:hypothetical protein NIIDMKKI_55110 [Mycobacterium kansasii]|uniref:Cytochrome P450 n=1 Tax=Mycobacterium kansasii TaxID=1768 RepID=A0A7G1IKP7_MYCKA|nr:hypothetical protein NIIDMKKI_55110 [Mycobacterium kansasii]